MMRVSKAKDQKLIYVLTHGALHVNFVNFIIPSPFAIVLYCTLLLYNTPSNRLSMQKIQQSRIVLAFWKILFNLWRLHQLLVKIREILRQRKTIFISIHQKLWKSLRMGWFFFSSSSFFLFFSTFGFNIYFIYFRRWLLFVGKMDKVQKRYLFFFFFKLLCF